MHADCIVFVCPTRNRCMLGTLPILFSFLHFSFLRNECHIACHDVSTKFSSISLQININYFGFLSQLQFSFSSFILPIPTHFILIPTFTLIHLRFVIHNNQFIGSEIKFHLIYTGMSFSTSQRFE